MLLRLAVLVVLAMASDAIAENSADGQYTIVGSRHIRFHSQFHVAVSVHNATEPATIRLSLENGADFKLAQEVTVQPWSTEAAVFELAELPPPASGNRYKLIAEGIKGIQFHNETFLEVIGKQFSFLVQSDKALYKPGDLVRFRVIVIDAETKPVDLHKTLQIHVEDGSHNRLKQWTNVSTTNGVFAGEFQLSDAPVLGHWYLQFESNGETKSYHFEVAEYVLPTFEAFIETPTDVLYKNGKILANVRGKYTFGKPVHGEAHVSLRQLGGWRSDDEEVVVARKVIKVSTKGEVEFDLVGDLQLADEQTNTLDLEVSLEEEFTGRQKNVSKTITVHRDEFKIQRTSYSGFYTEGKPFDVDLVVMRFDSTPVAGETVELWWSSDLGKPEELHSVKVQTDKDGKVHHAITFELNKSGSFLMAKFRNVIEGYGFISSTPWRPERINDFSLSQITENPSVGDTVKLKLESRLPLTFYTYQVICRGDIAITKTVRVDDAKQQQFEFEFDITYAMMPNVKVVVYTIRADQSVDVANAYVSVQSLLTNTITLEPSVNETQPGQEIALKITTPAKSFVGLLGVDQSVLLLRTGNDIEAGGVTNTLDEYANYYSRKAFNVPEIEVEKESYSRSHRYFLWSPTISSFENFGVFVLSNVKQLIPGTEPLRPKYSNQRRKMVEQEEIWHPVSTPAAFAQPNRFSDSAVNKIALEHSAMPQAGFLAGAPAAAFGGAPQPTIRKDFPETWIWDSLIIDNADGIQDYHKKVPDTITSWIITAFSLNPKTGFGLTTESSKLTVFRPFFVSLTLPYSVKRGEVVSIPVVVFNYMDGAVNADVTLDNADGDFEFVELGNEIEEITNTDASRTKPVAVKSNDGAGVTFMIRPLKVGQLTVKVTAVSPMAGDGIERILPVTPEGSPYYENRAVFVDLRDKSSLERSLKIDVPDHAVPGSLTAEISAIGDVMGATVRNIHNLIRLPSGCGEQNMLAFVPNILVRNYLKEVNQLDDELDRKTRSYMEIGYQRELAFRHHNGSFSAFGLSDFSGSTWLTAFVARSFRQAAEHIAVEERIVREALDFLRNIQAENGSFPEVGTVIHRQMQGGAANGIALTAYTLVAFLENKHAFPEYAPVIEKALAFVAQHVDTLDDVYATAVTAYALQLADHSAKVEVLRQLDAKAHVHGERKHWTLKNDDADDAAADDIQPFGSSWRQNSLNTEITSYALLAHYHAGPAEELVPIMKWLLAQRNSRGGFTSTQDTIVGLQALAAVAGKMGRADELNVKLSLTASGEGVEKTEVLHVNTAEAMVLQQVQLPSAVRDVKVEASGKGCALVSVSYRYYVNETGAEPRFVIEPTVDAGTPTNALRLNVSTGFIPTAETKTSNMAVVEVEFPSGFTFDGDTKDALLATAGVKKVETKKGDTVVVLYFDQLSAEKVQVTIDAVRTHKVAHQKPAAITVYDYYDTSRKSRVFYNTAETSLCDICEPECAASCSSSA